MSGERCCGGMCCGLAAPKDVYDGTVKNELDTEVTVAVTYRGVAEREEVDTQVVAPGASHFFAQRLHTEGSCTFTMVIKAVVATVSGQLTTVRAEAPFKGVNSPVKGFKWSVGGSRDSPSLAQSL